MINISFKILIDKFSFIGNGQGLVMLRYLKIVSPLPMLNL